MSSDGNKTGLLPGITDCKVISDTALLAPDGDAESGGLIYRDSGGGLHTIEFAACAAAFRSEHGASSGNCVGERDADGRRYIFYTGNGPAVVVFDKVYAFASRGRMLTGFRMRRFRALQKRIERAGYTTYDLT